MSSPYVASHAYGALPSEVIDGAPRFCPGKFAVLCQPLPASPSVPALPFLARQLFAPLGFYARGWRSVNCPSRSPDQELSVCAMPPIDRNNHLCVSHRILVMEEALARV